jgi:Fe-S-cluster containining protein
VEIGEKVAAVEQVFRDLDKEIASFQSRTGIHCKFGCGKCCFKADIEATILEFLPFAHHLYRQGVALSWHEKLADQNESLCVILNPTQAGAGLCSEYVYRGLICRLFGYSARVNKYSKKELVTCQIIKTEQSEAFQGAVESIDSGGAVPVMSQYYMKLHAIDVDLTRDFYPINRAIQKALETVMHYYAYRE